MTKFHYARRESRPSASQGKVYLVGAGPGDPELLTLKALRILRTADAVLHDELVSGEVLAMVPPTALVHNVGKRCGRKRISQEEIHARLVTYASEGLKVVRLKGGDPLLFGRAGEEMEALRACGIEFEVIPGVTAASAAAAATRTPLTDRRLASRVVFLAHHSSAERAAPSGLDSVSSGTTFVVYMPGGRYQELAERFLDAGLAGETPCVIVSRATMSQEQIHRTQLADLAQLPRLSAPALLIVGAVTAAIRVGAEGGVDEEAVLNTTVPS